MSIKIISSDNIIDFPKSTHTVKEVLELFLENSPKNENSCDNIQNAVIIYQTESGFAQAILHTDKIVNLIGALEAAKHYLLLQLISGGEISDPDDDDDY